MNEKIIEIKNLIKKYGSKTILKDLNIDIFAGDRIALIGANGVGKTTLIEMICGLRKINSGKINFPQGKQNFLNILGVQFQDGTYPQGIQVKDLVYLYTSVYGQKIDPKTEKELEIKEISNKNISSLSYGQKKRLELFLLLSMKAEFLILDEITSGMDVYVKAQTVEILSNYFKTPGLTAIYISHNLEEIVHLCNRMIILTKKGVVFDQQIDANFDVKTVAEKILAEDKSNYGKY